MAQSYNITQMTLELEAIGVDTDVSDQANFDEEYNRIIHLYDVFILSNWHFAVETAQICCTYKINKQPWQKAYRK